VPVIGAPACVAAAKLMRMKRSVDNVKAVFYAPRLAGGTMPFKRR
jgi:hypothetical protein